LSLASRALLGILVVVAAAGGASAANPPAPGPPPQSRVDPSKMAAKPAAAVNRFDIDDFAVQGANTLPEIDLEEAIYPYLGPNKTADDVEKARAALEKAYHDKGFVTVSVAVPEQDSGKGVVILKVSELKVGRLRVKKSRYFDIDKIARGAPSLKEGTVPNYGDVTRDIAALNQWPDRRVTPVLRAGVTPGTVDVDLNVDDKPPLHANVELNNRQSPFTTALRLTATAHYDDLWQLGHSFTFTYQVAPQRPSDAEVFSASYLARIPDLDWLNLLVYAVKSNSDVASVGGADILGPGEIFGTRAIFTLPARENFFQTISVGPDFKHFDQTISQHDSVSSGANGSTPITYTPLAATYAATFQTDKFTTQLDASVTYNLRPLSDDPAAFDKKRLDASPGFSHVNADIAHTQELDGGFQLYGKLQGQLADGPLVVNEQISIGGLDTVRGYLETEALGDNGAFGNLELRSPDMGDWLQKHMKDETGQGPPRFTTFNEWRLFVFADAGIASVLHALPEQQSQFDLWSYGVGTRFKFFDGFNGMVAYSVPMISQTYTMARNPRVDFRLWGEF
jgi:hemolysin activation/secretion protein